MFFIKPLPADPAAAFSFARLFGRAFFRKRRWKSSSCPRRQLAIDGGAFSC